MYARAPLYYVMLLPVMHTVLYFDTLAKKFMAKLPDGSFRSLAMLALSLCVMSGILL